MPSKRRVRLFRNDRSQTLRIRREFELESDEAIIHKEGDHLIAEPVRTGQLLALLATLKPLNEIFPDVDDALPPLDNRETGRSIGNSCGAGEQSEQEIRSRAFPMLWSRPCTFRFQGSPTPLATKCAELV